MMCIECIYNLLGNCPVYGSYNNAACITLRKSQLDFTYDELEEKIEERYRADLARAAKNYHLRIDYVKNLFKIKEEMENEKTV